MAADATDPANGGSSLVNAAEILIPCLDAWGATDVVEVGADGGDLTALLVERARRVGGSVTAIDPAPGSGLLGLAESTPELRLVGRPSHDVLGELPAADAVILDGDHNYHTVIEELRVLVDGGDANPLPLIVVHDIGWPHARRDTYYVPERIPPAARQPYVRDARLRPDDPGVADRGIPFGCAAEREGGPRNGVLTAIEDFLEGRDSLRFERLPLFWGIGFIWPREARSGERLASTLAPWVDNPLLDRLEAHRVAHLVERCAAAEGLAETAGLADRQGELLRAQSELLAKMLGSGAFALAETISRLHQRGTPVFSRREVEEVLGLAAASDAESDSVGREQTASGSSGGGRATGPAPSAAS